ncbi:MAG: BlaI/MecI/CopY family transcriptional regulator [Phycisphaerales bacterium]|nr:BlaI/MecI/CopY family transcriptional regulator [Phycisphaerales bacterium]
MARRSSEHPTEAELEILNVLWSLGPSTVRAVHEVLQQDRQTSLTTTLKLLQMMTEKGLTTRIVMEKHPHIYAVALPREKTQAGLLLDLVQKAFRGSVGQLVMRAVEEGEISEEELREIRRLMDGRRGKKSKS